MREERHDFHIGGETITAHFTDLANQASGSVLMKHGNTAVHVAVVSQKSGRPDSGFLPLTVDYEERFYARGEILGGRFVRREGKPSDHALLTSRMIDRAIRPFFPAHLRDEVQVVATTLSLDDTHEPGVLALIGASIALSISNIPWNGPLGAVRIGKEKGKWLINPPRNEKDQLDCELVVAGRNGLLVMLEGGGKEIPEIEIEAAVTLALAESQKIEDEIVEIAQKFGKTKQILASPVFPKTWPRLFKTKIAPLLHKSLVAVRATDDRFAKQSFLETLNETWLEILLAKDPKSPRTLAASFFEEQAARIIREQIVSGVRTDGRTASELRPLSAAAGGISEVVHGSGTFYRGATHVISFLTIGSDEEYLAIEGIEDREQKHFIHQYNFPPFSSGETGRIGSPNRRAIGHGALAERALRATLPPRNAFPRTIRLVSEVFASNGSTSMASVCAASLALADGGVPVAYTAGIAMGLIGESGKTVILSDIQGVEDHLGDMDCKVAGTAKGITALQLDVKNQGISTEIFKKALSGGRLAIDQILGTMKSALPAPRKTLKPSAELSLKNKQTRSY